MEGVAEAAPFSVSETGQTLRGAALRRAIYTLMLILLLEALDQTIVGTAMPRIIGQLHGLEQYSWVISAYLLAATTMLPISGALSDRYGRRRLLLVGTLLFLLGSLLCGLAQSLTQLIIFRALQGLGAGSGIALVFTAVGDLVPPAERGRWQGVVNSVYTVSAVGGPTLGGWLADHGPLLGSFISDASRWRWVFFINLPLGTLALIGLLLYLPANRRQSPVATNVQPTLRQLDLAGIALSALATLSLLLGLTWGSDGVAGWTHPEVVGALTVAVVFYLALLRAERRASAPLLPLTLFHSRPYAAVVLLSLLVNMALFGMAFYLPLYLQGVLGTSATQAGATMTPFSLALAVASTLTGLAISALKRYHGLALVGAALMVLGLFLLTQLTPTTSLGLVPIAVAIAGAGMGMLYAIMGVASLNLVPPAQMGVGAATVRYIGQLGGTVGVAIVATVVTATLSGSLAQRLPQPAVQELATIGVTVPSNPQVLVSPGYRTTLTRQTLQALRTHHPARPSHEHLVSEATQQAQNLVNSVLVALRDALAAAIQRGLLIPLLAALGALVAAALLTDPPEVP